MLTITHVAVLHDHTVYALPKPYRHHHVLWLMDKENQSDNVQGFLDNRGYFVTREKALEIARRAEQLNDNPVIGERLYSENVWSGQSKPDDIPYLKSILIVKLYTERRNSFLIDKNNSKETK